MKANEGLSEMTGGVRWAGVGRWVGGEAHKLLFVCEFCWEKGPVAGRADHVAAPPSQDACYNISKQLVSGWK